MFVLSVGRRLESNICVNTPERYFKKQRTPLFVRVLVSLAFALLVSLISSFALLVATTMIVFLGVPLSTSSVRFAVLDIPIVMASFAALISFRLFQDEWGHSEYKHCDSCSYNLTGNVSGRCPECGTEVET